MHYLLKVISFHSSCGIFAPYSNTLQNPRLFPNSLTRKSYCCYSSPKCRGVGISVPKRPYSNYLSFGNGTVEDDKLKAVGVKDIDVATIGSLCVDIVLNVPVLPLKPLDERKTYMEELSKSPPDKRYWEAGGNCNAAIAAARLGLRTVSVGHVGDEIYGRFLLDVLHDEKIGLIGMTEEDDLVDSLYADFETALCWVFVDPQQRHDFFSQAEFIKEPIWMSKLSIEAKMAITRSKIIFCNGYGFDELSPGLLVSALDYAVEVGTSIFFDPGPRGKSLISGTPEEQKALDKYLKLSDVLLLTSEEAESLTNISDPILSGKELLRNGIRTKWVIIKMGPQGSILITSSSILCAPAFKVNVIDTVGCGDSFMAAIAFGFIHKIPLVHTLAFANAVGAATATGSGAGRNVATLSKVLDLIKGSHLNEDDKFCHEISQKNLYADEVTVLTKFVVNGSKGCPRQASLQQILPKLLPELELVQKNCILACS